MLKNIKTKLIVNKVLVLMPVMLFFFLINTTYAAVLTPGNISTCGELAVGGTYTLDNDIGTSTETCLIITSSGVVIDGQSVYSINGNTVGNRGNYTINNATTTGDLSYFYYNNAQADGDWSNIDNWWLDSGYTETANVFGITIPTESDTVIVDGKVDKATAGTPTAHSATFINDSSFSAATLPLDIASDAAAAYSLRNLSSTYNGDVVEVRRVSDDTTRSFTAEEVENGTLLDFVVPTSTRILFNNAMYFDGVDDYVKIDNNFISSPTELTIISRFKKESGTSTYEVALHKSLDATIGASDYWLGVDSTDNLTATIGAREGGSWNLGQTNIKANYDQWYEIAAV